MNDTPETPEEFKERIRQGERAHDSHRRETDGMLKLLESFANSAMRAPMLVAAGGIAGALGFYSANYARLSETTGALTSLNDVIYWLLLSLLCSVIMPASAYLAQYFYLVSMHKIELVWSYPYVNRGKYSKFLNYVGEFFRISSYVLFVLSVLFICFGGLSFLEIVVFHRE